MRIVEHPTGDARGLPEADGAQAKIQQLPLPVFDPNLMFQQHALHHLVQGGTASNQAQQWRWEYPNRETETAGPSHSRNDSKVDEHFELPDARISKVDLVPTANLFATRLSVLWPVLPDNIQREPVCVNSTRLTRSIYSFLCAVAAFTMAVLRSEFNICSRRHQIDGNLHAENSVRHFDRLDTGGVADRYSIRTALLLSLCYWEWERPKLAWMCLHEAISLMQVSGYDKESAYAELGEVDAEEWRRLFWTLFVAERTQARRRGEPFRLRPTVSRPNASGQLAYLEGFRMAADTISVLRRGTTRLSAGPDVEWLNYGNRIISQTRQQLPLLPFVPRVMVWLSCLTVELQLWQSANASPELKSIKLTGRLGQNVPMHLLTEICRTLCSGEPLTFEVFGANLFLETIEVAMCMAEQLTLPQPAAVRSNMLVCLQQFGAWLELAEHKPQAAYQRFKEKLETVVSSIMPSTAALADAGRLAMSTAQVVPLNDAVLQAWSDQIAVQHNELVAPTALPQEMPGDSVPPTQACRLQDVEQGSPTMP